MDNLIWRLTMDKDNHKNNRGRSKTQGDLSSNNGKKTERITQKKFQSLDLVQQEQDNFCGFKVCYYKKSGDRYEGYHKDGRRHGQGTYLWSNGDKYSGLWSDGLMHGLGRFVWLGGENYVGEWKNGRMTGIGQKLQSDGSIINGSFKGGKLHGWAHKAFLEGDSFEGLFRNDSREGFGEYSWVDGSKYTGFWTDDNAHGVGTMIRSEGSVDCLNGKPTEANYDLDSYSGEYNHNRKEGSCTATLTDGTVLSGEFTWRKRLTRTKPASEKISSACLSLDGEVPSGWGFIQYCVDGKMRGGHYDSVVTASNSLCCAVSYEGDLVDGQRDGMGVVRYSVPVSRRHPLLETALKGLDDDLKDCLLVVEHSSALLRRPTATSDYIDPLMDEFPLEEVFGARAEEGGEGLGLEGEGGPGGVGMVGEGGVGKRAVRVSDVLSCWGGTFSGCWVDDQPQGIGTISLLNGQVFSTYFNT